MGSAPRWYRKGTGSKFFARSTFWRDLHRLDSDIIQEGILARIENMVLNHSCSDTCYGFVVQLANMTSPDQEASDGNLTETALAAVGMATSAVNAALLNVEQAVGRASQNKEVTPLAPLLICDTGFRLDVM